MCTDILKALSYKPIFMLKFVFTTKRIDMKIRKLFPEPPKIGNFSGMQYAGILRNIHPCHMIFKVFGSLDMNISITEKLIPSNVNSLNSSGSSPQIIISCV